MFNIGPLELIVLGFVGLVVLGPDRVPGLARDAGRLLRSLRDMATGARTQLREELGPEFADIDLRSLNPRTAITQVLLGEDSDLMGGKDVWKRAFLGDSNTTANGSANGAAGSNGFNGTTSANGDAAGIKPVTPAVERPAERPLGRGEAAPFDTDAT
jgi:sec-independent protein translocase protein TatB